MGWEVAGDSQGTLIPNVCEAVLPIAVTDTVAVKFPMTPCGGATWTVACAVVPSCVPAIRVTKSGPAMEKVIAELAMQPQL